MSYLPKPARRRQPDFMLTIINIVFLLLLFYLATGTLIQQSELAVDVPRTEDTPRERLPRPLLLIDAEGAMSVDGVAVDRSSLRQVVETTASAGGIINVLSDRATSGWLFVDVIAQLRQTPLTIRVVTVKNATSSP